MYHVSVEEHAIPIVQGNMPEALLGFVWVLIRYADQGKCSEDHARMFWLCCMNLSG